jgi:cytidyltransferase-like protein
VKNVVVTGSFDDLRSKHVRFLEEASKLGRVTAILWPDADATALDGHPPRFPEDERLYFLQAIRYVDRVVVPNTPVSRDTFPEFEDIRADLWAVHEQDDNAAKETFCRDHGLAYEVIEERELVGFPVSESAPVDGSEPSGRTKVLVTGCFDWFHTGHVRFFEEVSELGDLYVVVGHDANIQLLKGEKHPMFNENERRYMVQAIRYVKRAFISTGRGWLDAEPEIELIQPDIYAVNEDGDRPEKRAFCEHHGIEYVVLKREPKPGLPRRESTDLRGF